MRLFISYKRDEAPDERLAIVLFEQLTKAGHQPFVDKLIPAGTEWAKRIQNEIDASDWLIILLSPASLASEMVLGELELAKGIAKAKGTPRVLPIRIKDKSQLPYKIAALLSNIQWSYWDGEEDPARIAHLTVRALNGEDVPLLGADAHPPQVDDTPYPQLGPKLERAGSAVPSDTPYVRRESEKRALALLSAEGACTVSLRGPRQMGKTSVLNRLRRAATALKRRPIVVDFNIFEVPTLSDRRRFFEQLYAWVAEDLGLEPVMSKAWDRLPSAQACTLAVNELLTKFDEPAVFIADDVDTLFHTAVQHEALNMFRRWHESRDTKLGFRKLDILLATATDPDQFTRDDKEFGSPFNVGKVIMLEDFLPHQVRELARQHGVALGDADLDALVSLVAGQPYLTWRAISLIASGEWTLSEANLRNAAQIPGPFDDHLRRCLLKLQNRDDLTQAFAKALRTRRCEPQPFALLAGAGLVRGNGGSVEPRCGLYGAFFAARFNE